MNSEFPQHPPPAKYAIASWLGIGTLFLFDIIRMSRDFIHPDVAWYLYGTEKMLHGAILYRDIVDINPPLIYFLNIPPVWLAGLLGLSATAVFKAFVLVLIFGSLVLCSAILRHVMFSSTRATRGFVLFMVAFALIPVAAGNFGYIGTSFGQREHLLTILVVPYLLEAVGRLQRTELQNGLGILVGIMTGLGLAIKPHFVLLWFAIELYLAIATRTLSTVRRRENIVIASILIGYWVIVVVFYQEYIALVSKVMQSYGAYDATLADLVLRQPVAIWVLAGAVVVFMRLHPAYKRPRFMLYLAGTVLLLTAMIQRKGWGYQFYPARAVLIASIGFTFAIWVEYLEGLPRNAWWRRMNWVNVVAVVMVLGAARPPFEALAGPPQGMVPLFLPVLQQHAEARNIVVFSTTLDPQFPLVNYAGVGWSSRYPELWLLPYLYAKVSARADGTFPYHIPSEMSPLEREFYENVIADLLKKPPEILMSNVAEERYPLGSSSFNFIDYYSMDPRFTKLFAGYKLVITMNHFAIYKRQPMDLSLTYHE